MIIVADKLFQGVITMFSDDEKKTIALRLALSLVTRKEGRYYAEIAYQSVTQCSLLDSEAAMKEAFDEIVLEHCINRLAATLHVHSALVQTPLNVEELNYVLNALTSDIEELKLWTKAVLG